MALTADPAMNMMELDTLGPSGGFVTTGPRVGDQVITPGLTRDLQEFYDKSDSASDRAKCLELLHSIHIGQDRRSDFPVRPQTAMPFPARDPYLTTYHRDYPTKQSETTAHRPQTSQGFTASYDINGPIGDTTYHKEFMHKPARPSSPIRSGTASGARNNKPHPNQSFLIWRFPSQAKKNSEGPWSAELTDEMIKQVHKRLCSSTYQSDYLGIPQGFQVKSAYNLPPDWKEDIPYTLDSVARYSYQKPTQQSELRLPNTRYGSNKKKQLPASGTIPTASSRYMHIKQRTTYDRHFNDNTDAVVSQIRDVGHKLGAEALRKYQEKAMGEDSRYITGSYFGAYNGNNIPVLRMSSANNLPRLPLVNGAVPTLDRASTWTGPVYAP